MLGIERACVLPAAVCVRDSEFIHLSFKDTGEYSVPSEAYLPPWGNEAAF